MADPRGNKAGIISKPYGLQGKVNLILEPGAGKIIKEENPLFISIDGQRVPFFIEEMELVSRNHCIIKFEFIDSVEEARKICNCEVFQDPSQQSDAKENDAILEQLVGYTVIDMKTGHIGPISAYILQEHNPMFLVDHRGEEKMIPAHEDLIERIDHPARSVILRLPDGLIDL